MTCFWLCIITMTTVGFGDYYPVTFIGRIIVTLVGLMGIGVFGVYPLIIKILTRKDFKINWIKKIISKQTDFDKITSATFLKSLLISFCVFLISITTSYLLLLSFNIIPFHIVFTVFPLILLTNVLPVTIGNLGIREGATIYLLNDFKVSSEVAFNISILLFLLHSFIPALIGSMLIHRRTKRMWQYQDRFMIHYFQYPNAPGNI